MPQNSCHATMRHLTSLKQPTSAASVANGRCANTVISRSLLCVYVSPRLCVSVSSAQLTMPTLNISTNVPGNGIDNSDVILSLSKAVAASVGKPEQWVMVSLTTDKPMCYSGTEAPCAYGELISIGAVGGDKNKQISAAIADVLKSKLKIDPSRFYMKICDVQRSEFCWNGSTF